jgi:cation transport regulator
MRYKTNLELPAEIQNRLPEPVQSLYRFAFNSALQWYGEEAKAHQVALSAVRNQEARLNSAMGSI